MPSVKRTTRSRPALILGLILSLAFAHQHAAAQSARTPWEGAPDSTFAGMTARNIGPAGTSGRVAAIDAVHSDPDVIWVGAATGGVWKSSDGGITFEPVFNEEPASSIGAIAINQSAPDIVWVGTGEGNPRNSAGVGRGVWKTADGGESWTFLGLAETERIHRIVLHPTNPAVAWVAAMGPAWSDSEARGVYRTTDGGRSWERVLYVDQGTGASDLAIDPHNPDHLIAGMWDYRRWPWFFRSGGPGSGIWVSRDGGETWVRRTAEDGLPAGELGRIGVAFAPSEPGLAYALVEAEESALLRSDDGGRSWTSVNTDVNVSSRPFYYNQIAVDPTNENRIYRLAGSLDRSDDGGRSFEALTRFAHVHPDHHALWIDPSDGRTIINGNDGGVFISNNRGETWRFVENLPLAQFYHLSVDMDRPFNVMGGLQDNGSWLGPSEIWERAGFNGAHIMNWHWRTIGFGDGFAALLDPADASYGYSMSQGGNLNRFDRETGEWKRIKPQAPDDEEELRFNWNTGIAADPFEPGTIYYGSQYVHRSRDRGDSWEVISPDLTTDDPEKQRQAESGGLTLDVTAAENHTTIMTIAPSAVERGVIWVGTDDGNVQLTRDGGASWTNLVDRIPDVPEATWVPHIEASRHRAGTAYVVFDDHRRGNWETYLYRTDDYGRSWTRLAATPDAIDGFLHVLEEDPEVEDLLFAGGEFGLWFSLDRGESWRKWTGLPTVPVRALVVHPRDGDLAIGTHGRAAWILDDIGPLRAMARDPGLADRPLHLFDIPDAFQHTRGLAGPLYFPGHAEFEGGNRPYGALISYHLAEAPDSGQAAIEILDGDEVIRELDGPLEDGVNRVAWGLTRSAFRRIGGDQGGPFGGDGPEVVPGRYGVRVVAAGDTATGSVTVLPDPRREVALADRRTKTDALLSLGARIEELTDAVERLDETRESLEFVRGRLAGDDADPALRERADSALARLDALLRRARLPEDVKGIPADTTVDSRLGQAYGALSSSGAAPTETQLTGARRAEAALDALLEDVADFYARVIEPLRRELDDAGVGIFQG